MGGRGGGGSRIYPGGPTYTEYYEDIRNVILDWTMDPPEPGTSLFNLMSKRLDEYIGDHEYSGTVYRGLVVSSEDEVEKKFKDGAVIKAGETAGQRHASFTTDSQVAKDYAIDINKPGSIPVIVRVTNLKNARFLSGTEGSMEEVLAKNSNRYEVIRKKKGRLAGGVMGYQVWLKQI